MPFFQFWCHFRRPRGPMSDLRGAIFAPNDGSGGPTGSATGRPGAVWGAFWHPLPLKTLSFNPLMSENFSGSHFSRYFGSTFLFFSTIFERTNKPCTLLGPQIIASPSFPTLPFSPFLFFVFLPFFLSLFPVFPYFRTCDQAMCPSRPGVMRGASE